MRKLSYLIIEIVIFSLIMGSTLVRAPASSEKLSDTIELEFEDSFYVFFNAAFNDIIKWEFNCSESNARITVKLIRPKPPKNEWQGVYLVYMWTLTEEKNEASGSIHADATSIYRLGFHYDSHSWYLPLSTFLSYTIKIIHSIPGYEISLLLLIICILAAALIIKKKWKKLNSN